MLAGAICRDLEAAAEGEGRDRAPIQEIKELRVICQEETTALREKRWGKGSDLLMVLKLVLICWDEKDAEQRTRS
jgi:hypothetical protein